MAARRRAWGSGSITKKGTGWLVRAELGEDPITGKRIRFNRVVQGTKSDAQRVLDEAVASRPTSGRSSDLTLGQLIAMWRSVKDHSNGTARNYDNAFRLIPPDFLDVPARKIDTLTFDTLYRTLLARGASVDTVRYLHAGLGAAYTQAMTGWGLLKSNPVRAATPPAKPRRKKKVLTEDMPARLMAAAESEGLQIRTWLALHLTTGARRSEVLALTWGDLDLDRRVVSITTAIDPDADELELKDTKGGDERTLPLSAGTVDLLTQWRQATLERGPDHQTPWVFSLDGERPWRPDYATKKFAKLARRAGVAIRLHDTRHLVGTLASDVAGANDKAVAAYLGHADERTTHGYLRAMPARAHDIASTLDRLLFPGLR